MKKKIDRHVYEIGHKGKSEAVILKTGLKSHLLLR